MKILQFNSSKFLKMFAIIILGLFSMTLFAQNKEESKTKLDQLKGKVEKITVKVDGKDVVFEGEEAQKMADQLKSEKRIKIMSSAGLKGIKESKGNVMIFKSKEDDNDSDEEGGEITKKVNVEVKDGKKVVTITTNKDGKEETTVYEGEKAEKFIQDNDEGVRVWVSADGKNHKMGNNVYFFNRKNGNRRMGRRGCDCSCGEGKMEMAPMKGMGPHKIIMKKLDKDDDDSEVIIEKKEGKELKEKKEQVEKKGQKWTEKK